jgi:hypothetical protein
MTEETQHDPDAAQAAIEYCYAQGWSDGLPLVPASQPLVDTISRTGALIARCPWAKRPAPGGRRAQRRDLDGGAHFRRMVGHRDPSRG